VVVGIKRREEDARESGCARPDPSFFFRDRLWICAANLFSEKYRSCVLVHRTSVCNTTCWIVLSPFPTFSLGVRALLRVASSEQGHGEHGETIGARTCCLQAKRFSSSSSWVPLFAFWNGPCLTWLTRLSGDHARLGGPIGGRRAVAPLGLVGPRPDYPGCLPSKRGHSTRAPAPPPPTRRAPVEPGPHEG